MAAKLLVVERNSVVRAEHRRYDGLGDVLRLVVWGKDGWLFYTVDMVTSIGGADLDADVETRICVERPVQYSDDEFIVVGTDVSCVDVRDGRVEVG